MKLINTKYIYLNDFNLQKGVLGKKCSTKKPTPAAKTTETAIANKPTIIPPLSSFDKI